MQAPPCSVLVRRESMLSIHSGRPITCRMSSRNWALSKLISFKISCVCNRKQHLHHKLGRLLQVNVLDNVVIFFDVGACIAFTRIIGPKKHDRTSHGRLDTFQREIRVGEHGSLESQICKQKCFLSFVRVILVSSPHILYRSCPLWPTHRPHSSATDCRHHIRCGTNLRSTDRPAACRTDSRCSRRPHNVSTFGPPLRPRQSD